MRAGRTPTGSTVLLRSGAPALSFGRHTDESLPRGNVKAWRKSLELGKQGIGRDSPGYTRCIVGKTSENKAGAVASATWEAGRKQVCKVERLTRGRQPPPPPLTPRPAAPGPARPPARPAHSPSLRHRPSPSHGPKPRPRDGPAPAWRTAAWRTASWQVGLGSASPRISFSSVLSTFKWFQRWIPAGKPG